MELCHKPFVLGVKKKHPNVRLDLRHTQQLNAMQTGEAEHLAEERARRRA